MGMLLMGACIYKNYKEQIHPMHYTSPAHPQEKKQEYQIDHLQRLVTCNTSNVDVDVLWTPTFLMVVS